MNTQKLLKENINELLEKEMDRKDFLKHVGVAIVALTGVAGAVSALTGQQRFGSLSKAPIAHGYGSMPYGGNGK